MEFDGATSFSLAHCFTCPKQERRGLIGWDQGAFAAGSPRNELYNRAITPTTMAALHYGKHNEELQLCAFDVVAMDGGDMRRLPLSMRKANLARLLRGRPEGIFINLFEQGEIGPDSQGLRVRAGGPRTMRDATALFARPAP
jgi:hypothetical protein